MKTLLLLMCVGTLAFGQDQGCQRFFNQSDTDFFVNQNLQPLKECMFYLSNAVIQAQVENREQINNIDTTLSQLTQTVDMHIEHADSTITEIGQNVQDVTNGLAAVEVDFVDIRGCLHDLCEQSKWHKETIEISSLFFQVDTSKSFYQYFIMGNTILIDIHLVLLNINTPLLDIDVDLPSGIFPAYDKVFAGSSLVGSKHDHMGVALSSSNLELTLIRRDNLKWSATSKIVFDGTIIFDTI